MKKKIIIIMIIISATFLSIPVVYAAIKYSSSDVYYDNTLTGLGKNVQDAIDDLDYSCSRVKCPVGKKCKKNTPICKRATTLNTEPCSYTSGSSYCYADGYYVNGTMGTTTITYGNQSTTPGVLTVGDAFDCDVNGNGNYTERFYYISEYYDTIDQKFNDSYAVLVYYSTVSGGVANNTLNYPYDDSGERWHGPQTAYLQLPKINQWNNIKLYRINRLIRPQYYLKTMEKIYPFGFDYNGYAARLLTFQELNSGCYDHSNPSNSNVVEKISTKCLFLMENTKYSDNNINIQNIWLETPNYSDNSAVYGISVSNRGVNERSGYYDSGVRPVIEILKSDISY